MASGVSGDQIRAYRQVFGLTIDQFSRVLGVHPVTLNRWELARDKCPEIDGMAWNVLAGLHRRMPHAPPPPPIRNEARRVGTEIEQALIVGGVLVALAVLLAFVVGAAKK